jgi:hypothetical protein
LVAIGVARHRQSDKFTLSRANLLVAFAMFFGMIA